MEKDVSECMHSIRVLYTFLGHSHCVCVSFVEGSIRKKKKRVESWFGETDHVEIKRGFFAIHLSLNSRIRVSPAIEKGNK